MMNLLKSTLIAYLAAATPANGQEEVEPSLPNLNGQNFKITVRINEKYLQHHDDV